ncbi:MAG: glutaredoxin family protein [Candidatus Rokubacteria bacterium]|nr:glutaredoxin family protein [Candidatus Rokubacteria bacterium]
MIVVEVYGKRDCCLCDEAKAVLLRVRREIPFDLREIDIESTPGLHEDYKERIPLILINGRPAFKFRVDVEALRRRLTREQARVSEGEIDAIVE